MGDDDIKLELFAEKDADPNSWDQPVTIKGTCLWGCKTRKMLNTKNLVKALGWIDYHRDGPEHVAEMLRRSAAGDFDNLPEVAGSMIFDVREGGTKP